jgi:glycolate dehydrogenase iron-sulfur subunit
MHVELHPDFANTPQGRQGQALTSACVHCGFCLATCPTYLDKPDERDSPRGRIYLIRQLLETGTASAQTHTHLDRCLTCRSCETTCPSGMQYAQLLDIGRGLMEQRVPRPLSSRAARRLLRFGLGQQRLFTLALRLGQLLRPLLPARLARTIPPRQARRPVPDRLHSRTMLVLEGCVQQAATPATNEGARRVLDRLGITLKSVPGAGCCGAVNYHLGAHADGLDDMRRNIDAWWPHIEPGLGKSGPGRVEAIVSSASGCGSTLVEYGRLLAHDPVYADKARRIAELTRDLGEILLAEDLAGLGISTDVGKVAVQTPCSMQHGLQLSTLIGEVLEKAGFELAQTSEQHLCCGSAGTYSILQGATSRRLRDNKLRALGGEGPALIATGNVGCQLHLQTAAAVPVVHWIQLLDS